MAKKKKRESTDKKSNKQSSRNCNSKKSSNSKKNTNSKDNIKFSDFSYAELIVLASTFSYSLFKELDEEDIAIYLVFLGLLLSNMQVLVAQKAIKAKRQAPVTEDLDLELETEI
ncbi:hypothetical protein [Terrisporobacter petrolearius]|uniref:hypothetical protein n=1 Tax=Terrisporobacter petrolearius TaxID=1460447 RepID=UPI003B009AF9